MALLALRVTSLTGGEGRKGRRHQDRAWHAVPRSRDAIHAQHWGVGKAVREVRPPTSSASSCLTNTHCFAVSDWQGRTWTSGSAGARAELSAQEEGEGKPGCHLWPSPHTGTQHRRSLPGEEKERPASLAHSIQSCRPSAVVTLSNQEPLWRQGLEGGYSQGHPGTWVTPIINTILPPAGECPHLPLPPPTHTHIQKKHGWVNYWLHPRPSLRVDLGLQGQGAR